MNYADYGYLRLAAIAPTIVLANPERNAERILEKYELLSADGCSLVLSPELSITGYSCEDLFLTDDLLDATCHSLVELARNTNETSLVVGAPLLLEDGRLLNAAVVLGHGQILGGVPKIAIPNHAEFYESRWFASGIDVDSRLRIGDFAFQVSAKQLFRVGGALFAIEICEDLWIPQPPSAQHAINGATILLNPSASPEQVEKSDYRRDLVRMQSGACVAAYLYAGAASTESSKDVVYGGHMMAAENARLLAENDRFQSDSSLIVDVDWHRLRHERTVNANFRSGTRDPHYRIVGSEAEVYLRNLKRRIDPEPFVPNDEKTLTTRAEEILDIQSLGLTRRFQSSNSQKMVLGLSGGLDSTLALLVCMESCRRNAWNTDSIYAVTMPGPGTSKHTRQSVCSLADATDVLLYEIPIFDTVTQHLADIKHESSNDVTFENVQARIRTQTLFDLANKHNGIVVGTGDLSELALGWCTYNADHMSSYNVNASIPKTLVKHLVEWYATNRANEKLGFALKQVLSTPISPELLPSSDGEINQKTEDLIGPFELHDFFLYHFLRSGASVAKILVLASQAFEQEYEYAVVKHWLGVFFERFHRQQFKRSTLPPGPKVGTVSLSPRGDWRMPDETEWTNLLPNR